MKSYNILNKKLLPDLLSDTEFDYYFKKFRDGNIDSLDILVVHNTKLVYWYIEKYINCKDIDYDEIFSVGLEALVESFYRFDLSYNVKFSTFATACIKNKILKYFRSESKHDKVQSLEEFISDSHNSDTLGDMIIDYDMNVEDDIIEGEFNLYLKEEIAKILDSLDEIDRNIIMLYFGFYDEKLYRQKEICKFLGISQSQVSKRLSSLLKKLKIKIELLDRCDDVKGNLLVKKVA